MITVTFQCESLSALKAQLREFLGQDVTGPERDPEQGFETKQHDVRAEEPEQTTPAPQAAEKKRTRRTKAEMAAAKAAKMPGGDVFTEESAADESPAILQQAKAETKSVGAPIVNKQAVHEALQQVNVAVGLPKAREILASFNVNRISEVRETDFKAFIEKCNEAVMLEG